MEKELVNFSQNTKSGDKSTSFIQTKVTNDETEFNFTCNLFFATQCLHYLKPSTLKKLYSHSFFKNIILTNKTLHYRSKYINSLVSVNTIKKIITYGDDYFFRKLAKKSDVSIIRNLLYISLLCGKFDYFTYIFEKNEQYVIDTLFKKLQFRDTLINTISKTPSIICFEYILLKAPHFVNYVRPMFSRAVCYNNEVLFTYLVEYYKVQVWESELIYCINNNNLNGFTFLLHKEPKLFDHDQGKTLMSFAVWYDNGISFVEYLYDKGARFDTDCMYSILDHERTDILKFLVSKKITIPHDILIKYIFNVRHNKCVRFLTKHHKQNIIQESFNALRSLFPKKRKNCKTKSFE